jgi:hypothetical protein
MRHKIRSSRRGPSELLCGGNVVSLHDRTMITSGLPVIPPGPMPSVEITSYKPTYRDGFAPVGKISCTLTYSARSALMSASKTNGSTTPAWLIAIPPLRVADNSEVIPH